MAQSKDSLHLLNNFSGEFETQQEEDAALCDSRSLINVQSDAQIQSADDNVELNSVRMGAAVQESD